ncbi:MAG: GIY-YIG nuclease family protein, partial [Bacteroidota bacterium]
LQDHNSGRNHATKHGHNWVLIHSEMLSTRSEAMRREKWLKSGTGREWLVKKVAGWSSPQVR